MRAPRWTVASAAAAMLVALPSTASAATHKCAPVTIGADRFTHITARGVTCKYVRTVFAPSINHNVEPPGWAEARPVHLGASVKDTFLNGTKKIVFIFTVGP